MNGGAVMNGAIAADVRPAEAQRRHMVRIAMRENFMAGCELEVNLSAEDAAFFASTIFALAKAALKNNKELEASEPAMV
jgi:uncharacterized membrane protein